MKFGELIRLQPGYIFAVKADLKKPVTIKANCFLTILAWGGMEGYTDIVECFLGKSADVSINIKGSSTRYTAPLSVLKMK
jgi:hypothetical protein